jgi:CRISPR/Cas system CMR-associated protein Cmr5 small subunit
LQSISPEEALKAALNKFEQLYNEEQLQQIETDENSVDVDSYFECLQEAQKSIINHVKTQISQQKNEINVEKINYRSECIDKVRSVVERAMKLLNRAGTTRNRAEQKLIDEKDRTMVTN